MSELTATIHTNQGDIVVDLFPDHAPKTVANFVGLADGTREYSAPNAKGDKTGPFYDGVDLPPGDRRLHDPGRRPDGHRPRRPRLHSSATSSGPS